MLQEQPGILKTGRWSRLNRIENAGQVKTGYSVKSGTNSEEKVGNGSDFASMLTKYKKKAAQDDETKKANTARRNQKQGK